MKRFKLTNHFHPFIRNIQIGDLLEVFLIAAISSVLSIRAFLAITGYPQLGGGRFHIAHMLWGGLIMMVALFLVLAFLNKEARIIGAMMGGVGFGLFIDELGKFITRDNDYFFQPTIAILYIIFVLIFLSIRAIEKYFFYSKREYTVNAVELIKEAILHDLDREEKKKALQFLQRSDTKDPIVKVLRDLIIKIDAISVPDPSIFTKMKISLSQYYRWLTQKKGFTQAVVYFFILTSSFHLLEAAFNIRDVSSFFEMGQLLSSILSGLLVIMGIYYLRKSRLAAYEMFKRSLLVTIFLTQFFIFYKEQLLALVGLATNILVLLTLQYLIDQERLLGQ